MVNKTSKTSQKDNRTRFISISMIFIFGMIFFLVIRTALQGPWAVVIGDPIGGGGGSVPYVPTTSETASITEDPTFEKETTTFDKNPGDLRPTETITPPTQINLFASDFQFQVTSTDPDIVITTASKNISRFALLSQSETQFQAKVYFDVECNLYTTYSLSDLFPDMTESVVKEQYLFLVAVEGPLDLQVIAIRCFGLYNTLNLGTFHQPLSDQSLSIKAQLSTDSGLDPINISAAEVTTTGMTGSVKEIILQTYETSKIGMYDTVLTNLFQSVDVQVEDLRKTKTDISSLTTAINTLGYFETHTPFNDTVKPGMQTKRSVPTGQVFNNRISYTWQPDITLLKDQVTLKERVILYDPRSGEIVTYPFFAYQPGSLIPLILQTTPAVENLPEERILATYVQNYCARLKFRVEVDVTAQVAIKPRSESNFYTDLPLLDLSTMYFQNLLYNTTPNLSLYDPWYKTLWQDYWWILLIAAAVICVFVFFYFAGPLLFQRMNTERIVRKIVGKHGKQ